MNDVIALVDEDNQSELSARLQSALLGYRCHGFSSHCYPVDRWLDERSLQLCQLAPTAVGVTAIQVRKGLTVNLLEVKKGFKFEVRTELTVNLLEVRKG